MFSRADARRGCAAAAQVNRQARRDHDAAVLPVILALRAQGLSLTTIGVTQEPPVEESRLLDRFCHLMRKTSSNSLAFWRRKGMSGRIFTDEEREAARHNRREARQRLADEASATVHQLLADVGSAMPAWAFWHAEK